MKRKIAAALAILLVCSVICTGCTKKNATSGYSGSYMTGEGVPAEMMSMTSSADTAYGYAEEAYVPEVNDAAESDLVQDASVRKMIYTARLSVTTDEPDATLDTVTELCLELGGYLADSSLSNDETGTYRATATLKVPADKLDVLLEGAKGLGKVNSCSVSGNDVTMDYYDIAARLESAKAEEAQLTAVLEKCETVEDILYVRSSLAEVRSDIEAYQGRINLWDNLVSYATLELTIKRTAMSSVEIENEDIEIWKASDVWKKMSYGFKNTARWLVNALYSVGIFLAYAILPGIVIGLIIWLVRKIRKKNAAKFEARREKKKARKEERKRRVKKAFSFGKTGADEAEKK